ncbi:FAD-binding oxidoreductase [Aquimarina sp. M1]
MNPLNKTFVNLSAWGRYQKIKSKLHFITSDKIPVTVHDKKFISFGNGRSYGDCALQKDSLQTNGLNKIISLEKKKGLICCESGVLLSEIIERIVPHGWFLPVTPGTKYITLGGAIAADIHGKNHHKKGCFSQHILYFKLLLPNENVVTCSKIENVELFKATCGGMGLTGVILEVSMQLMKIQSAFIKKITIKTNNLEETFFAFDKNKDSSYAVAWIDALAEKDKLGKGLLFLGEHANDNNLKIHKKNRIKIPKWFPSYMLNKWSIRIYNKYYYYKHKKICRKVALYSFFYPLDTIANWNRIYGSKGFIQYQVVIPKLGAYSGIKELLELVSISNHTSYLTVLKLLGKENENYLSFPLEGYTVTMDFKIKKGLYALLDCLDAIVTKYNGRAYLAKDVRMSQTFFEKGYPKLAKLKSVRELYKLQQLQSLQSKRLSL